MLTQEQADDLNQQFGLNGTKLLIVFAHGKESGPWGTKITRLAEIGKRYRAQVISPDYSDLSSPEARVARLRSLDLPSHERLVLVGSSMGGYVSVLASNTLHPSGLFLMAPAIGLGGYAESMPTTKTERISIVHGWRDNVVPPENVFRFAAQHSADLHLLDAQHDLQSCLAQIEAHFINFLHDQIDC